MWFGEYLYRSFFFYSLLFIGQGRFAGVGKPKSLVRTAGGRPPE
jgi:hypothetical protein